MQSYRLQHIAFIMDGNRRWATKRALPATLGHSEGAKVLEKIVEILSDFEIPYATFYALSTENLQKRSQKEIQHLFTLLEKLIDHLHSFMKNKVCFRVIGNISVFPERIQNMLTEMIAKTKDHMAFTFILALNYGGRDEIVRATKKLIYEGFESDKITEEVFAEALDTHDLPDVDLVIRTGGNHRLSNYLPWQTVYAELFFTDTLWPSFRKKHLVEALDWFISQKRNRGK